VVVDENVEDAGRTSLAVAGFHKLKCTTRSSTHASYFALNTTSIFATIEDKVSLYCLIPKVISPTAHDFIAGIY
jgi:hypothetical protein